MKKFGSIICSAILLFALSGNVFAADSENPSDVEGIKAEALNGSVKVSWKAATDNTNIAGYQVHYGLNSIGEAFSEYDDFADVGDVLSYTVSDLENGKKYYFSVIAYDAAGNESVNWGIPESSATPSGDLDAPADKIAPQVKSAEALNIEEVKVVFSEEVVLPKDDPQNAFSVENDDDFELLEVSDVKMDEEDKDNTTVILSTDPQEESATYTLTVGIEIKDKAGNSIISGTSDTAMFTGSAEAKEIEDAQGPKITKVETVDSTHVGVSFNEAVVLNIDPSENFQITQSGDPSKTLAVLGVKLGGSSAGVEDAFAVITTAPQEKVKYTVKIVELKDEAGNDPDATASSAEFEGIEGEVTPPDVDDPTPPSDVANFIAKAIMEAEQYVIKLTWQLAADTQDVSAQLLYQSNDKGQKYDMKASLAPTDTQYDVEGLSKGEYWFKLTQKDSAGNESAGVVTKVILAETGPEMIGLVVFSLILGRIVTKKKRQ
ncbi:hypothetical protein A3I58_02690 [Candidatus Peregrinibacteria bacterium RIFCSPLOWO2_02_FULL_39_10]|nr:MAG: hypothetical protein A3I58_02690 [Candidatus Peregrinibacteria bacterium RIFCSPLOWO2_02_FULL_39_10]